MRLQARLEAWVTARIAARLEPLLALRDAAEAKTGNDTARCPAEARGIAHQLAENFGALDRATLAMPCRKSWDRRSARSGPSASGSGGAPSICPGCCRPDAAALLALLWGVWTKQDAPPAPPAPGLTSFAARTRRPDTASSHAAGFRRLRPAAPSASTCWSGWRTSWKRRSPPAPTPRPCCTKLVSLLGSGKDEARAVLAALGWRAVEVADAKPVWRRAKEKRRAAPSRQAEEARTAARSQLALCRPCGAALAMTGARLDKWLFHARFYRTRLLAQAAASAGKVRLKGPGWTSRRMPSSQAMS